MLVVPQGFTLSIAGVLALTIGHHGFPGLLAIWLFIAGASIGFCAMTLASGAHTEGSNRHVSIVGMALMKLLPILVVPAACSASWWVGNKSAAFFVAGFCGTVLYVGGSAHSWSLSALAIPAQARPRRPQTVNRQQTAQQGPGLSKVARFRYQPNRKPGTQAVAPDDPPRSRPRTGHKPRTLTATNGQSRALNPVGQ